MRDKIKFNGNEVRRLIRRMIEEAGGGHAGGSLSIADVMAHLYSNVLHLNAEDPSMEERDRFILSKGHSSLALYAALALRGFVTEEDILKFGSEESAFMNHPDAHRVPGIEVSTGSLGHGFPLAVGIALAGKIKHASWGVYTIIGDGELQEGSVWEAAMYAAHHKLSSLTVIVDRNQIGNDGSIDKIANIEPLIEKWSAFGWEVVEADGHAKEDLIRMLPPSSGRSRADKRPHCVIAHTIKGYGLVSGLAGSGKAHYISGSAEEIAAAFVNGETA